MKVFRKVGNTAAGETKQRAAIVLFALVHCFRHIRKWRFLFLERFFLSNCGELIEEIWRLLQVKIKVARQRRG